MQKRKIRYAPKNAPYLVAGEQDQINAWNAGTSYIRIHVSKIVTA